MERKFWLNEARRNKARFQNMVLEACVVPMGSEKLGDRIVANIQAGLEGRENKIRLQKKREHDLKETRENTKRDLRNFLSRRK